MEAAVRASVSHLPAAGWATPEAFWTRHRDLGGAAVVASNASLCWHFLLAPHPYVPGSPSKQTTRSKILISGSASQEIQARMSNTSYDWALLGLRERETYFIRVLAGLNRRPHENHQAHSIHQQLMANIMTSVTIGKSTGNITRAWMSTASCTRGLTPARSALCRLFRTSHLSVPLVKCARNWECTCEREREFERMSFHLFRFSRHPICSNAWGLPSALE